MFAAFSLVSCKKKDVKPIPQTSSFSFIVKSIRRVSGDTNDIAWSRITVDTNSVHYGANVDSTLAIPAPFTLTNNVVHNLFLVVDAEIKDTASFTISNNQLTANITPLLPNYDGIKDIKPLPNNPNVYVIYWSYPN